MQAVLRSLAAVVVVLAATPGISELDSSRRMSDDPAARRSEDADESRAMRMDRKPTDGAGEDTVAAGSTLPGDRPRAHVAASATKILVRVTGGQSDDPDGDGVTGSDDNCQFAYNPDQFDGDGDGLGNPCDAFNNCGDAKKDQTTTSADVIYLINYVFKSGAAPDPTCGGDLNGDGAVASGDIITLINYVFKSGPPPTADCCLTESIPAIPPGAAVAVDGVIAAGEWDDAMLRSFIIDGRLEVTVMIKHDGTHLLAAYHYTFLGTEHLCLPELLIDVGNDKTGSWLTDDWWFHVSGTDCEAHGTYDVYNDCSVVQPDWQAVPNFELVPDPPVLDTFEVRIPLAKIGAVVGNIIGIAFRVEYVPSVYGYWPPEAAVESPASWSTAVLKP